MEDNVTGGGGESDLGPYCLQYKLHIVRPANRDWACQTERCHTLSYKTSLQ